MVSFRRLITVPSLALVLCTVAFAAPVPQTGDPDDCLANLGDGLISPDDGLIPKAIHTLLGGGDGVIGILYDFFSSILGIRSTSPGRNWELEPAVLHKAIHPLFEKAAKEPTSNLNRLLTDMPKAIYILQHMGQLCSLAGDRSGTQPLKGELDTADGHMFTLVSGMSHVSGVEAKKLAPDNAQSLVKCYPKTASLFGLD